MEQQIPLKKCKLWWPAWQQGIPFTSYGYFREITGEGYRFAVNPEMDSWLCENGDLMPINTAKLALKGIGYLKWNSFSILGDIVQVNTGTNGYIVRTYALEDLYFVGESYPQDE